MPTTKLHVFESDFAGTTIWWCIRYNKGCVEYRRSIRYGDGARLKIRFYANLKVDIRFHQAWIRVTQEAYLVQCITCIAATTHPQQIANIGTTSNRNFLNSNSEEVIISDHFQRQKNTIRVFPPLKTIWDKRSVGDGVFFFFWEQSQFSPHKLPEENFLVAIKTMNNKVQQSANLQCGVSSQQCHQGGSSGGGSNWNKWSSIINS